MKRLLALLFVPSAILLGAAAGVAPETYVPPLPAGNVPGRFLLVSAAIYDETAHRDLGSLFRIDTATGRVWKYVEQPTRLAGSNIAYMQTWLETVEKSDTLESALRGSHAGKP